MHRYTDYCLVSRRQQLTCDLSFPAIERCRGAHNAMKKKRNMVFLNFFTPNRIESKHEVTILGGLNEFSVKFYGPRGSEYICFYIICIILYYKQEMRAICGTKFYLRSIWNNHLNVIELFHIMRNVLY